MKFNSFIKILCGSYFLISILSCKAQDHIHGGHGNDFNKTWIPELPNGYRLIPKRGIDSYVGEITNDTLTFMFDYGLYGGSGPANLEWIKSIILNDDKKCLQIINKSKLKLDIEDFKKIFSVQEITLDSSDIWIDIQIQNEVYRFDDMGIYERDLIEAATLENITTEHRRYKSRITYPKNSNYNNASLIINEKNSNNNLNLYTRDYQPSRHGEIMLIFQHFSDNHIRMLKKRK